MLFERWEIVHIIAAQIFKRALQESVHVLVERHFKGVTKFEKLFRSNLDGVERGANESPVS